MLLNLALLSPLYARVGPRLGALTRALWGVLTCFFLIFLMVLPLGSSSYFYQPSLLSEDLYMDAVSLWLLVITLVVRGFCIVAMSQAGSDSRLAVKLLVGICASLFMSSKLMAVYVFYEASLLPISYIILKHGGYRDRAVRVLYMLIYTAVFSFPMLISVLYLLLGTDTFLIGGCQAITAGPLPGWLGGFILMGLAVKLPIYGLHYWLPKAHVEAPTFGSMVLAGILLKLGGYSLFRVYPNLRLSPNTSFIFVSYLLAALGLASLATASQSDFKRLVAYSSVVHITPVVLVLFLSNSAMSSLVVIMMVIHGVLSPLMFYIVGYISAVSGSRAVLSLPRLSLLSPVLSLVCLLAFCSRVPTPPFPQFFLEVLLFMAVLTFSGVVPLVVVGFTVLRLVYNLVWFTAVVLAPSYSRYLGASAPSPATLLVALSLTIYGGFLLPFVAAM